MPAYAPDRRRRLSAAAGLLVDWVRRDFRVRISQTLLGSLLVDLTVEPDGKVGTEWEHGLVHARSVWTVR